jgi:ribosomal protein L40E
MTNDPQRPRGYEPESSPPPLHPQPPPPAGPETFVETLARKSCPACGAELPNGAFVCRVCRFNLRTETFTDIRAHTNGLAVASLTMGLVALMIFPLIPLSALGGLLALVMGGAATRQIKKSEGTMSGGEMARFGLALGLVAVLVALGLAVAAYLLDIEVINVDLST